jgi:twitching motility protein PilT
MAAIDILLQHMVRARASDLHLSAARPPMLRVFGEMAAVAGMPPLDDRVLEGVLFEIMPDRIRAQFLADCDTDFAYMLQGVGRFRVNVFRDTGGICAVLRHIPDKIISADDLGLSPAIRGVCDQESGLVLVTGPTGSGKSTTLAALVDIINKNQACHILTIEDPVEFMHTSKRSLIRQREVNVHTRSFSRALRAALREDPDVVLVGELRDLETVEIALETAETGHLVFGTLHTNSAIGAVDRIVDQFPANKQEQIRLMMAETLRAVFAQTLIKRKDGNGRAAAIEVMIVTDAVAANVREGKTHQIGNIMQTNAKLGMVLMAEAIVRLVKDGTVSAEEAYSRATDKLEILRRFKADGIVYQKAGEPELVGRT